VEAGHRCAIPTCRYPTTDLHHIIPWETCQTHDFDNLIALCPNCHRRAESGEIDRKSLRLYKSRLSAALGTEPAEEFGPSRIIAETVQGLPGYEFEFQFPHFSETDLRVVTLSLEAWGNELLQGHRSEHYLRGPADPVILRGPNTTSASYDLVRNDSEVLSIKYRVNRYFSGAAHGSGQTVTCTYLRQPLFLLSLEQVFDAVGFLEHLSQLSRAALLADSSRDEQWVLSGTEPKKESFRAFNVGPAGLLITFDEYQVDCYAAGPQVIEIPAADIADIVHPRIRSLW
jgi:hypothetical protein